MTRDKEEQRTMTKFDLSVLLVLNHNRADTSSAAMSISQILSFIDATQRKSYSTAYRHLNELVKIGYIKCGLLDGLASTYYIVENGKTFCKAHN